MLQLYCQVVNKLQEMLETHAVKRTDWCDGTFGTVARLRRTQIDPLRVCVRVFLGRRLLSLSWGAYGGKCADLFLIRLTVPADRVR